MRFVWACFSDDSAKKGGNLGFKRFVQVANRKEKNPETDLDEIKGTEMTINFGLGEEGAKRLKAANDVLKAAKLKVSERSERNYEDAEARLVPKTM